MYISQSLLSIKWLLNLKKVFVSYPILFCYVIALFSPPFSFEHGICSKNFCWITTVVSDIWLGGECTWFVLFIFVISFLPLCYAFSLFFLAVLWIELLCVFCNRLWRSQPLRLGSMAMPNVTLLQLTSSMEKSWKILCPRLTTVT